MQHNEHHPVIEVSGLCVSIDEQPITHEVSFALYPGHITALVGESGSGKSLSALSLMGLLPSHATTQGQAVLHRSDGADLDLLHAHEHRRLICGGYIGMIFQEPSTAFNPVFTIGYQIEETLRYHAREVGNLNHSQRKERVLAQLREVELADAVRVYHSYPHELSGGQLQRAMIAMALINRPTVLIADEPTTALDVTTQREILQLMQRLANKLDLAVLLITHDMGVVWAVAHDVYVMQHGRIVEHGQAYDIFTHPKDAYTYRLLTSVPRLQVSHDVLIKHREAFDDTYRGQSAVSVEHVSLSYSHARLSNSRQPRALDDVHLRIDYGTTHALVGESGAGKTTLAKVISGQLTPHEGTVMVQGENLATLKGTSLRKALSRIGYVFQDSGSALNPRKTVGWSIAEPLNIHTNLSKTERQARVLQMLQSVHLPEGIASRYPHELSGGQRQRVGIARSLILRPSLLIADEPTSSLDVTVQKSVLSFLHDLQQAYHFACLLITHDLGIVQEVAHTISVMQCGRIVEHGEVNDVLAHPQHEYTRTLLTASLGNLPPISR